MFGHEVRRDIRTTLLILVPFPLFCSLSMVYFLLGFEPYFLYFLSKPVIPTTITTPTSGHAFSYRGGKARQLELPDANAVSILSITTNDLPRKS